MQEHGCKLIDLRALVNKSGASVAAALVDIFTIYGPPAILQSDNGSEFSGHAATAKEKKKFVSFNDDEMMDNIDNIKKLWPDCLMVHGRPRHSQSQGELQ